MFKIPLLKNKYFLQALMMFFYTPSGIWHAENVSVSGQLMMIVITLNDVLNWITLICQVVGLFNRAKPSKKKNAESDAGFSQKKALIDV